MSELGEDARRSSRSARHLLAALGVLALWRAGDERAAPIARSLFRTLVSSFLDRDSLFPRHSPARHRRGTVCVGGIVYFLRVLHEYVLLTGDEYAETLFQHAVSRVVATQGPGGEWPWFFDVHTGSPIDVYPVYGVHQDSMSMLFLLPAYDRGLPGMDEAIERSYAWVLGRNQLGTPTKLNEPFLRYRALERTGHLARAPICPVDAAVAAHGNGVRAWARAHAD